jgi:hypothetical protein
MTRLGYAAKGLLYLIVGAAAALATLYMISRRVPARSLFDRVHARLAELPSVTGGASELPNDCGASVRILGGDSISVSATIQSSVGRSASRLDQRARTTPPQDVSVRTRVGFTITVTDADFSPVALLIRRLY